MLSLPPLIDFAGGNSCKECYPCIDLELHDAMDFTARCRELITLFEYIEVPLWPFRRGKFQLRRNPAGSHAKDYKLSDVDCFLFGSSSSLLLFLLRSPFHLLFEHLKMISITKSLLAVVPLVSLALASKPPAPVSPVRSSQPVSSSKSGIQADNASGGNCDHCYT